MDLLQNNKYSSKLPVGIHLNRLQHWSILFFVFTMPFVSAFAFTGTISLPLIAALLLFILMLYKAFRFNYLPRNFIGFDLIIVFLLLIIIVASFFINGYGNSKAFNHTIAYIATLLLFYVAIKFSLFDSLDKKKLFSHILLCITLVTAISATFAVAEFILANFFDFKINELLPRPFEAEKTYNPTVIGLFIRARGFETESGHFAFMMELLSPLAIYHMFYSGLCSWNRFVKILIVILIVFSFLFAVSTASFVIIPSVVLLVSIIRIKKIYYRIFKNPKKIIIVFLSVICVVFVLNNVLSLSSFVLLSLADKLDSTSLDDREERINFFFDQFSQFDFNKYILGSGPAGFDILGFDESRSILSLYYSVTFEIGILGVLAFIGIFLYALIQSLKIKSTLGFFILTSVISGIVHYYFIANFWYPWFWFIIAFAIFCSKELDDNG